MVLTYGNMLWWLYGSRIFTMMDGPWTCMRPLPCEGVRRACSLSMAFPSLLSIKNPSQKWEHFDFYFLLFKVWSKEFCIVIFPCHPISVSLSWSWGRRLLVYEQAQVFRENPVRLPGHGEAPPLPSSRQKTPCFLCCSPHPRTDSHLEIIAETSDILFVLFKLRPWVPFKTQQVTSSKFITL